MAEHTLDPKKYPPPQLLLDAQKTEKWGLPYGEGWKNQPIGLLEQMEYVLAVHNTYVGVQAASDVTKFFGDYPSLLDLYTEVEKWRKELADG